MKKYTIKTWCDGTYPVEYESTSRNAKQHLINNFGGMGGGVCEIWYNDELISCCRYICDDGGKYYYTVV